MLLSEEVDALKARVAVIKAHVDALKASVDVIEAREDMSTAIERIKLSDGEEIKKLRTLLRAAEKRFDYAPSPKKDDPLRVKIRNLLKGKQTC